MTFTEAVGARIRALRKKRGWTLVRLAREVGLSRSHVSHIERAERTSSIVVLHWFARVFDTSVSTLLEGIEDELCPGARGERPGCVDGDGI